jgi:hypothetical protein
MAVQRETYSKQSPFESGKILYGQGNTSGWCGEMTNVAIYIAVGIVKVPSDKVWMLTFTAPERSNLEKFLGTEKSMLGHSTAFIGETVDPLDQDGWAVDPWMGLCCRLRHYVEQVDILLQEGTRKNRRINVPLTDGSTKWVEPSNEMVTSIFAKKGRFTKGSTLHTLGAMAKPEKES